MPLVLRLLQAALSRIQPAALSAAVNKIRAAGVAVADGTSKGVAQRIYNLAKENPIKAQIAVGTLISFIPDLDLDFVEEFIDSEANPEGRELIGAVRSKMNESAEKVLGDGDEDTIFGVNPENFDKMSDALDEYRPLYAEARYFFPRVSALNSILSLSRLEPSALDMLARDFERGLN